MFRFRTLRCPRPTREGPDGDGRAGQQVRRARAPACPVQERSRRRVEAILDATERLVVERGVEALTTREIALGAGVPGGLALPVLRRQGGRPARPRRARHGRDGRAGRRRPRRARAAGDLTVASARRDRDARLRHRLRAAAAPSSRSTCAGAPTPRVHAFGREHNVRIAARPARARPRVRPGAAPDLTEQVAVLAVEVGDRVFQLAYEHDPRGDAALVEEGVAMMTAYLERYAAVSPRPPGHERARRRRRAPRAGWRPRACSSAPPATCQPAGARPGRGHRLRRRAGRLPGPRRRARRPRRHASSTAGSCPTSELGLHLGVYADQPARGAVVHTHAPWSTAVACVLDELPVLHYQQLLLGGAVRVAPYATFGSAELAASRARRARGPPGRADGQPRLGRRRRHASTRPSSTPCCSSGSPRCTTAPRRSARPACSPTPSRRTSSSPPCRRDHGTDRQEDDR